MMIVLALSLPMCVEKSSYIDKISENHCQDCPSESCLCVKDQHGRWYLSPEY